MQHSSDGEKEVLLIYPVYPHILYKLIYMHEKHIDDMANLYEKTTIPEESEVQMHNHAL